MKSLLVIAHGSRREASNDEIRELTERITEKAGANFDLIVPAFLELAEPSIPEGIKICAEKGATEILVMPYFLSAGRHVAEDIPGEVDSVRDHYPDVNIRILPYLGSLEVIPDIMIEQAISNAK
jgi:sirohydrochlorin ferrochelatase